MPVYLLVGPTPTLRNWTVEKTSCSVLSASLVNVEYVGNGSVCILECKVLFILQEICASLKGKRVSQLVFLSCSTIYNILHVFTFV